MVYSLESSERYVYTTTICMSGSLMANSAVEPLVTGIAVAPGKPATGPSKKKCTAKKHAIREKRPVASNSRARNAKASARGSVPQIPNVATASSSTTVIERSQSSQSSQSYRSSQSRHSSNSSRSSQYSGQDIFTMSRSVSSASSVSTSVSDWNYGDPGNEMQNGGFCGSHQNQMMGGAIRAEGYQQNRIESHYVAAGKSTLSDVAASRNSSWGAPIALPKLLDIPIRQSYTATPSYHRTPDFSQTVPVSHLSTTSSSSSSQWWGNAVPDPQAVGPPADHTEAWNDVAAPFVGDATAAAFVEQMLPQPDYQAAASLDQMFLQPDYQFNQLHSNAHSDFPQTSDDVLNHGASMMPATNHLDEASYQHPYPGNGLQGGYSLPASP